MRLSLTKSFRSKYKGVLGVKNSHYSYSNSYDSYLNFEKQTI